jgi:hypothetical protein
MVKADNNNNPEVLSLGSILERPVASAQVPPTFVLDENIPIEPTTSAEFDPEPAPEPAVYVEEPTADAGFMSSKDIGETIVNLLDGMQSSAIPFLREKKVFSAKEMDMLRRIDKSGKATYTEASDEHKVLQKWLRHKEIIAQVPFTTGEKGRLIRATARYAETTGMNVTPFQGLLLAYSEVIVTRVGIFMGE